MKFCPKCGSQCQDSDAFCPSCGNPLEGGENFQTPQATYTPVQTPSDTGSDTLGILGLIFSFFSCIGLILDIVALASKSTSKRGKTLAKIGIGIVIAEFVIGIIIGIVLAVTGTYTAN